MFLMYVQEGFALQLQDITAHNPNKASVEQVVTALYNAGFNHNAIDTMVCIAKKESNLKPQAINTANKNGTKDYGIMQINTVWIGACNLNHKKDWSNLDKNVKCAKKIYDKQGLRAWVTYKKYCYKKESSEQSSSNQPTLLVRK